MSDATKVLFVTYSFPPDAEVGGKRTARFCRYLPEFGVQPTVLTVQDRYYEARDLSYALPPGLDIVRTRAWRNPLDAYRDWAVRRAGRAIQDRAAVAQQAAPATQGKLGTGGFIFDNVLMGLQTPDRYWGWYWHGVRAGADLVRQRGMKCIISSGPPWTSHLVARGIHRRTGVPWIADFRDGWTLDPWIYRLPRWLEQFNTHLQRTVVQEAHYVVCVSDVMTDDFRSHYAKLPGSKFVTITNGIDGAFTTPAPPTAPQNDRLVFHLGSLYGDRRVETLFRAVIQLIERGNIDGKSLRLLFTGNIEDAILLRAKPEIDRLKELSNLVIQGIIPFAEGQRLIAASDVLLLIQGNHPHAVPAKYYEYIVTGKPILVLAKDGVLSRLVRDTGTGMCADPDDVNAIATELLRALGTPQRTQADNDAIIKRFHFRSLTEQLVELIRGTSGVVR